MPPPGRAAAVRARCALPAVLLVLAVWLPAPAGATSAAERVREIQLDPRPPWAAVVVEWEVSTGDPRGALILYRGATAELLRAVEQLPAAPGVHRYRFQDLGRTADGQIYQLRYRTWKGREVVLATARVRLFDLSSGDGLAPQPVRQVVALPASAAPPGPALATPAAAVSQARPVERAGEPPVPPPRRAAAARA